MFNRTATFPRQSLWLTVWGVMWGGLGLAYRDAPQAASLPLYAFMPMFWQGMVWLIAGLVCLAAAWAPRFPRVWGFAIAPLPPFLWAAGFAEAWIVTGREYGWQGLILWTGALAAVILSAGDADVRPER